MGSRSRLGGAVSYEPGSLAEAVGSGKKLMQGSYDAMTTVRARSTNTQLVERLVAKYEGHIRRFIRVRSGSAVLERTTVDDIYQETVAAALTSADNFVFIDDAQFLGWIRTVARRVIAHSVRGASGKPVITRLRRERSTGAGTYEGQLPTRGKTPSSIVAAGERKIALTEALQQLRKKYRDVITLYQLESRPLSDVAQRMRLSERATSRLFARAVGTLRGIMIARLETDSSEKLF